MVNVNLIHSKDKMSKQERVMATLEFKETDRVALFDLMENPGIIQYFSGSQLKPPEFSEYNLKIITKAISNSLDITRSVYTPRQDKTFTNELGVVIRQESWTSWIEKRPFSDNAGAAEFVKKFIKKIKSSDELSKWNYFGESGYDKSNRESFINIKKMLDGTVLFFDESIILTTLYVLLGMEKFVMLYDLQPQLISECLKTLFEHEINRIKKAADSGESSVVLVADDIAYKGGLIFSPDFLRKEFFPNFKLMVKTWKDYGFKCIFHSDGNYMKVMEDLIDSGVDGVNPIEPLAGWDLIDVRKKYPNLVLMGNIDVSQLLSNGTPEEAKTAVKKAIDDIYQSGGLLLGSSTELGPYVNPKNYITMNLFAREYSRIKPFVPRSIEDIQIIL